MNLNSLPKKEKKTNGTPACAGVTEKVGKEFSAQTTVMPAKAGIPFFFSPSFDTPEIVFQQSVKPDLWTVRLTCAPQDAPAFEDWLGEEALAVSTFAPPRAASATVEALVDGKPDEAALQTRLALFAASQKTATTKRLEIFPVGNLDWIKKVAEDFPPLPLARWTVFGAAHKDKIKNPRLALQIDATSAFGTGEHPTTKGCLILLDKLLKAHPESKTWRLLDMGCGSGILAMAFAKACRGRAVGVDMDPPSVKIAVANARANGVAENVRFEVSLGYRHPIVGQNAPYDLVMANIFARPLCQMAKDLKAHLKPGGYAILSGILNTQAEAVLSAHRAQGLFLVDRMRLGEWSALALCAPIRAS